MRWREIDPLIEAALGEDMPRGDITSESLVPPDSLSEAVLLAKQDGVVAGIDVARRVFRKIDPGVMFTKLVEDVHGVKSVVNNMTIEEPKKE